MYMYVCVCILCVSVCTYHTYTVCFRIEWNPSAFILYDSSVTATTNGEEKELRYLPGKIAGNVMRLIAMKL